MSAVIQHHVMPPHMSPLQQFFTVPYVQHHMMPPTWHPAFVAGFTGQGAHCEVWGWSCWVRSGGPTWFGFWLIMKTSESETMQIVFWLCYWRMRFWTDLFWLWFWTLLILRQCVLWLWFWIQLILKRTCLWWVLILKHPLFLDCAYLDSATGTVFLIVISRLILKPVLHFAFGNEIEVETSLWLWN